MKVLLVKSALLFLFLSVVKGFFPQSKARSSSNGAVSLSMASLKSISWFQKLIAFTAISTTIGVSSPSPAHAENIPLETAFKTIQYELDARKSLGRIENDISNDNWEDLKLFTREYDAGLRGSVMKSVWKQLEGEKKEKGIQISNSFTFDLIGLNKAARKSDKEDATKYLKLVEQDIKDFVALKN